MATPDIVVCSLFVNRPVRTRMPWWCGDWGLETPGYPIRRMPAVCADFYLGMFGHCISPGWFLFP